MQWLSTYGNIAAAILMLFAGFISTLLLGWLGYHRLRWRVDRLNEEHDEMAKAMEKLDEAIVHIRKTRPSRDDLKDSISRVELSLNNLRLTLNDNVTKLCSRMDSIYTLLVNTRGAGRRQN
jgi:hypothetical protein